MRALIVAAALGLTGCATIAPDFTKEGMSEDRYFADRYECLKESRSIHHQPDCGIMDMYARCMIVRDYRIVPNTGNVDYCIAGLKKKYSAEAN